MTTEPSTFLTRRATSWQEAKELLEEYSQHYIFRGQASADWLLKTSIERCSFFAKSYHVEKDLVRDFQRAASSYPEISQPPPLDDFLSWLAIMQHYGAPTRLIDFTYSPFIAAYFALESAVGDCAVWAVEHDQLKGDLHHKWHFEFHEDIMFDVKTEVYREIFEQNKLQCLFPVRPPLANRRYLLQQSVFLSLGNSNETFMQQLAAYPYPESITRLVHQIVIPTDVVAEALWDLNRMNINRSTLFGDLEAYSIHLKNHYELRHDGAPSTLLKNSLPPDRPRQYG